jgi:hypothetical protein
MAMLYRSNGTLERVAPAAERFTLAELQALVSGYIEVLRVTPIHVLVFNEEGKLHKLPPNLRATLIADHVLQENDFLVGDVLCCRAEELSHIAVGRTGRRRGQ